MADHAVDVDNDGDIFIYRGGRAPHRYITHARIDKSIDEIEDWAFSLCERLLTVDTHDGIRRVGQNAFRRCRSLKGINFKSAVEIDEWAFSECDNLESAEFGDRLETIGYFAFSECDSLKHLKLPSIITIRYLAFDCCRALMDIDFSERLQTIGKGAFNNCERLQRIVIPLKRDLFVFNEILQRYTQFDKCEQLTTVDLLGQAHTKTIASLHMDCWRAEMIAEIDRINQVLPNTSANEKADEIQQWMESVIDKLDHYKAEHYRYVNEGITLLELALWKAKLDERKDNATEESSKMKEDAGRARKESRMLCGADMVIKNVLSFLQLD